MGTHLTRFRAALIVLLVTSGVLFAIGSTIERHQHQTEHHATGATRSAENTNTKSGESTTTESAGESTTTETGGEGKSTESKSKGQAAESSGEAGATLLGVNTESLGLSLAAVVASLLLALLVWLGRWPRLVLLCVAAFGLVFAAGDARELVHQLNESNAGLAVIAAILIGLHLTITALAALLIQRQGGTGEVAPAGRLA